MFERGLEMLKSQRSVRERTLLEQSYDFFGVEVEVLPDLEVRTEFSEF